MMTERRRQGGFTLLEVLIALTISSMVLGSLFSLAAGSKQLALRTQNALIDTMEVRAHINFALLDNDYRGIEPILEGTRYRLQNTSQLADPPRRTMPMSDLLQSWELVDQQTGEHRQGVRWITSDLPR
jgi:prepilin-type N-terminal cleavage/methylation domain-containing protein